MSDCPRQHAQLEQRRNRPAASTWPRSPTAAPGVGLAHGDALLRFASACGGTDDAELAAARAALVAETDEAFMVDAAAVAANFEMMTRLADGTGAAMPAERLERSARRSRPWGSRT